ncbi:MAG: hypothetical protein LBU95_02790 [Rikenellaceae bacterium]|nr:hypothetical protein [Rikenellaceae bacterium]
MAENCGFNSFSTFRRSFLARTGLTPAQYCRQRSEKLTR